MRRRPLDGDPVAASKEVPLAQLRTPRESGWRTIRRVAPFLWPEGERRLRWRVVAAMVALLVAKLATVATPWFFKAAVDGLAPEDGAVHTGFLLAAGPVALTIAYGTIRLAGARIHPAP